ncbi:NAD-dependent DNA ligase LigA [Halobacteriovorax sp. YZS-1-1]|uniref:NAD-dependent DNA ligase LigA n=1 Tax=unclassified Halobacteriovorax TaxID=2639665 RepID=UPI00399A5050
MNKIKLLEDQIKYHKALYYRGEPEISDIAYDKIEDELREIDPDNPVLNLVGSTISSLEKVKHDKKMLSLGKTYKIDELINWAKDYEVLGIYKVDGVSCSLIYENGKLVIGKTRGDGTFGENITQKVQWMKGVPSSIQDKERIEIRGEMYCDEESFFKLSEAMISQGLEKPTSQRNIVAGLVGRKENINLCSFINFKAFDVLGIDFDKEEQKYHHLQEQGFDILEYEIMKSKKDFEASIEDAKDFMANGDYLIDGLVFVYNDIKLHHELGETAHHPRYKMAFKFPGETVQTILKSITWQVSRNGILTPVGEVEPVSISGAVVSRVTLHNFGMVKQHNLKAGDKIEIIRSGEVIPKFLQTIKESENDFSVPTHCPSCDAPVKQVDIRIICDNPACPAQVKEVILNFIQKIGIDDLSSKRLEEMIRRKLVTKIEDLYNLNIDKLIELDKVKEKLATKLLTSIEKSKKADLITFLSALGITGGAYNKCEKVVGGGFDSIEKLLAMTAEKLQGLEGFAEKSATTFVNSLQEKKDLIKNLQEIGFTFEVIENDTGSSLAGIKICITGSLSRKRSEIEKDIKAAGGTPVSSVSKNTDILLTNETEAKSSKYKKALELGITIKTEDEVMGMINGQKE